MSKQLIYDLAGRGIQIAASSPLIHQCNCINVSTFNGTHDEFCAIAHLARDIDVTLAERDTELAQLQQAKEFSEANAAALKQAVKRYLNSLDLNDSALQRALRETNAGIKLLIELDELRYTLAQTSAGAELLRELKDLRELQQRTADALLREVARKSSTGALTGMRRLLQRLILWQWE